jgi:hypothetical protein
MTPPRISPHPPSRLAAIALLTAPPAAIILTVALLSLFPPAQYHFYPQCPIHQYFHLDCPGCGATRALAALLHGHLLDALRLNALTTFLLPIATFHATRSYIHLLRRHPSPIPLPQPSRRALQLACVITLAFTILRNLPR